jgi:two-component system cell cycle response regulator
MLPAHVRQPHSSPRIGLLGFSEFERATLESYFRLAGRGCLPYELVQQVEHCELIVANADAPDTVYEVGCAGRMPDTLFIGERRVPGRPAGQLQRPIDALQIRRALDHLLAHRLQQARVELPHGGVRARAHVLQLAQDGGGVQDFRSSSGFSNSVLFEDEAHLDDVLVVSNSPAECSLLRPLLSGYGYRVTLAGSSQAALAHTREQRFAFIFLGIDRNGTHGLQIARQLKRQQAELAGGHGNSKAVASSSTLVALSSHGGPISRIRATFAGCDAYLSVPLDENALRALLARHDRTFERVFEPTAPMAA